MAGGTPRRSLSLYPCLLKDFAPPGVRRERNRQGARRDEIAELPVEQ